MRRERRERGKEREKKKERARSERQRPSNWISWDKKDEGEEEVRLMMRRTRIHHHEVVSVLLIRERFKRREGVRGVRLEGGGRGVRDEEKREEGKETNLVIQCFVR